MGPRSHEVIGQPPRCKVRRFRRANGYRPVVGPVWRLAIAESDCLRRELLQVEDLGRRVVADGPFRDLWQRARDKLCGSGPQGGRACWRAPTVHVARLPLTIVDPAVSVPPQLVAPYLQRADRPRPCVRLSPRSHIVGAVGGDAIRAAQAVATPRDARAAEVGEAPEKPLLVPVAHAPAHDHEAAAAAANESAERRLERCEGRVV
mmetsp:Transcript_2520/g.8243  ORF Transcript_2520/g.8243 Transcript_2520/m.8243 type:complete len:205 (-) Transcript_2520:536-1150(-)